MKGNTHAAVGAALAMLVAVSSARQSGAQNEIPPPKALGEHADTHVFSSLGGEEPLTFVRRHAVEMGFVLGELRPREGGPGGMVQRFDEWIGDVELIGSEAIVAREKDGGVQVTAYHPSAEYPPALLAKARAFRLTPEIREAARDLIYGLLQEKSKGRFGSPDSEWAKVWAQYGLTPRDIIKPSAVILPGRPELYLRATVHDTHWIRVGDPPEWSLELVEESPYEAKRREERRTQGK